MRWYSNFKICEKIYFLRSYETGKFWETSKLIRIKPHLVFTFSAQFSTLLTSEELQTLKKCFENFFYLLAWFPFTTSETELYAYQNKLNIWVSPQFAKLLNPNKDGIFKGSSFWDISRKTNPMSLDTIIKQPI